MTASEFAEKRGIPYQTVVRWARQKLIPGVKVTEFGKFKIYMIQEEALHAFDRPKTGRPPLTDEEKEVRAKKKAMGPKARAKKAKAAKKGARAK
ncbi:MAG: hypothetical protein ACREEM_14320 [Blastocatellia bacterium]